MNSSIPNVYNKKEIMVSAVSTPLESTKATTQITVMQVNKLCMKRKKKTAYLHLILNYLLLL